MNTSRSALTTPAPERTLDALGMLFSVTCLLHCLALPLLLALLPLTAASVFADERFHQWMLLGVVPVSALALGVACLRRRAYKIAALGLIGVGLLTVAAFGPRYGGMSEATDTHLTVIGALLLSVAHLINARASGLLHWHRRGDHRHAAH